MTSNESSSPELAASCKSTLGKNRWYKSSISRSLLELGLSAESPIESAGRKHR